MLLTSPQPLKIEDSPPLRYHPLSGFGCADYVEEYAGLLQSAGIFDSLKYSAAELRLTRDQIDLAGFAALASAFASALVESKDRKALRKLIIEHCQRFRVQVQVGSEWIDLNSEETIGAHLDFGQMVDVVLALAGGVLRPLWSRLLSAGEATPNESQPPSMNATPAS